jgi:hypothetical protein
MLWRNWLRFKPDNGLRVRKRGLAGQTDAVWRAVAQSAYEEKATLVAYLKTNAYRMHYDQYLAAGMMIASGPVESAHRTLLQVRMKRSGQHWSQNGCKRLIKLRVASKSDKLSLITQIIKKQAA